MNDSTTRFSSRVDNYVKYRPGYPAEVIDVLKKECGLTRDSIIADIGSGTGILTELLLKNGNRVFGIEPNKDMRDAGERLLKNYSHFTSVNATAEATTLPDHSVDLITAGQAFHWFDRDKCRDEFKRILKPGGWIALIWNERRVDSTPFLRAYETLLHTYGTDYEKIDHRQITPEVIQEFFRENKIKRMSLENKQIFDFDGLRGRLLSSSYVPEQGHPRYEPMLRAAEELFDTYKTNGKVSFDYDTNIYVGHLYE
ncbi:MAG TPA: methyltransferase domain-containing protein [Candidatus Kapabacteria bacterium]|nr:methyltransferase domain-containing protein [Candidatus Kapabacteria bacterium]